MCTSCGMPRACNNHLSTPCPKIQCWRALAGVGVAQFYVFARPPLVSALGNTTLNLGGKGCSCASVGVADTLACSLRTFFRQQSRRNRSRCVHARNRSSLHLHESDFTSLTPTQNTKRTKRFISRFRPKNTSMYFSRNRNVRV